MECNGTSQTVPKPPDRQGEEVGKTGNAGDIGGAPAMGALLVLNGLLLAALAMVTFGPTVTAQTARGRGEYTAVAGGAMGTSAAVVYVADVVNQELIALSYNREKKLMEGIAWRNLRADQADLLGGRLQPGTEGKGGVR
jgi:hypothetical protein